MRRTLSGVVLGVLVAAVAAGLSACGPSSADTPPREPGPPRIVVTIAPVAGLVRAVAGEGIEVTTLLPAGASPHGFELTPADVRTLSRADLIVAVGLGIEPWLESRLRSAPRLADRAVSFADLVGIEGDAHTQHDHHAHEGHEHCHSGPDPHLWLDPVLAAAFLRALPEYLPGFVVAGADAESAAAETAARVDAVDASWRSALAPFAGSAIVTHHAAFGRPAERYGLTVAEVLRPVESAEPSPAETARAIAAIRDEGARAIFIEPQFNAAAAERLASAAGVPLGRLDPLGAGDWFAMMRANLDELVRTLGDGGDGAGADTAGP